MKFISIYLFYICFYVKVPGCWCAECHPIIGPRMELGLFAGARLHPKLMNGKRVIEHAVTIISGFFSSARFTTVVRWWRPAFRPVIDASSATIRRTIIKAAATFFLLEAISSASFYLAAWPSKVLWGYSFRQDRLALFAHWSHCGWQIWITLPNLAIRPSFSTNMCQANN